jgi:hypothetical protein
MVQKTKNYSWLVLTGIAAYWVIVFGLANFTGIEVNKWLVHLGVPAVERAFSDTGLVGIWCDWAKMGRDPFLDCPVDSEGRYPRMNYPPIFLVLGWLGLSGANADFYGMCLAASFYFALAFLAKPTRMREALLWITIACSPVVVFAVERGNFDLLIFVIIILSINAFIMPGLSLLLLMFASCLKLFPIVGCVAFLDCSRRGWVLFFSGVALFVIYLLLTRPWLPFIFGSLDGSVSCAFGVGTIPTELGKIDYLWVFQLAFGCAGLIAGASGLLLKSLPKSGSKKEQFAARLGIPVFLLLFLSGAQFDYKLIFLLLAVPWVLHVIRNGVTFGSFAAKAWLGFLFAYLYWMFFSGEGCLRNFLLKQIVVSTLFLMSALLCGGLYRNVLFGLVPWWASKNLKL